MANCHPEYDFTSRDDLVGLLNEDLAREYQAVISYVVYAAAIKGPQYMAVAVELERHAADELSHALIIAQQIDYLGGMPQTCPKHVRTSFDPEAMLRFDLEAEVETICHYRQRVRQCESIGEYAVAQQIRAILVDEQHHLVSLASALGIDAPNAAKPWPPIEEPGGVATDMLEQEQHDYSAPAAVRPWV
ncbi:MAG: ferritin-like domain-containing protein [Lacipirellulaceae bacterium]